MDGILSVFPLKERVFNGISILLWHYWQIRQVLHCILFDFRFTLTFKRKTVYQNECVAHEPVDAADSRHCNWLWKVWGWRSRIIGKRLCQTIQFVSFRLRSKSRANHLIGTDEISSAILHTFTAFVYHTSELCESMNDYSKYHQH